MPEGPPHHPAVCRGCRNPGRVGVPLWFREGDEISKPTRTHWDMLLERRSEEELATLLEKRLQMHRDGWIPDYE